MNYFNLLLLLSGVLSVNSLHPASASLDEAVAVVPEKERTITLIFLDKDNPKGKRAELEESIWKISTVL